MRWPQKYNGDGFMVLPINLDIGEGGLDKAQDVPRRGQVARTCRSMPIPRFKAFERLKTEAVAIGLPATLLLDEKGCELARAAGPGRVGYPGRPQGHRGPARKLIAQPALAARSTCRGAAAGRITRQGLPAADDARRGCRG